MQPCTDQVFVPGVYVLVFLYSQCILNFNLVVFVMFKSSNLEGRLQCRQQAQHAQTSNSDKPCRQEFKTEHADCQKNVRIFAPFLNSLETLGAVYAMVRMLCPAIKEDGSVGNRGWQRSGNMGKLVHPIALRNDASIRLYR